MSTRSFYADPLLPDHLEETIFGPREFLFRRASVMAEVLKTMPSKGKGDEGKESGVGEALM